MERRGLEDEEEVLGGQTGRRKERDFQGEGRGGEEREGGRGRQEDSAAVTDPSLLGRVRFTEGGGQRRVQAYSGGRWRASVREKPCPRPWVPGPGVHLQSTQL